MSLGFLTESALIPKKAVPIKVDSSSVLDLKSIIYDGERGVAKKSVLQRELGLSKRKLQAGLGGPAVKRVKIGAARTQTKATKNKGVEKRNRRDKKQNSKKHVRAKALAKLKRKAELYNKLQSMNTNMLAKDDDISLAALKEEMVVDFSKKEHLRVSSSRNAGLPVPSDKQLDDQVVIEDEFGRTRTVKRGSREHMRHVGSAYRHQKAELERLIEQMDQEDQDHAPKRPAVAQPAQPVVFIGGQEWGGGAVDQWARRLDREQRAHLEEIKAETTEARARSAEMKSDVSSQKQRLLAAKAHPVAPPSSSAESGAKAAESSCAGEAEEGRGLRQAGADALLSALLSGADGGDDDDEDEVPAQKPSPRAKPPPPKIPAKVARHVAQSKQDEQLGAFHAVPPPQQTRATRQKQKQPSPPQRQYQQQEYQQQQYQQQQYQQQYQQQQYQQQQYQQQYQQQQYQQQQWYNSHSALDWQRQYAHYQMAYGQSYQFAIHPPPQHQPPQHPPPQHAPPSAPTSLAPAPAFTTPSNDNNMSAREPLHRE